MSKFSKSAAANKPAVVSMAQAEVTNTISNEVVEIDVKQTEKEEAPAFVPVDTPEKEDVSSMQERIDQLEKMVRSVSDRNAVEKFDDSQKGKGNTRYSIPLYEGKVVSGWNYKNERDVKLRGADADNSVIMEMYDGTKIELTYQLWVKTMYVSEQIPHESTSNKDGKTLITFSFKAEDDEYPKAYTIDKRYLNAR